MDEKGLVEGRRDLVPVEEIVHMVKRVHEVMDRVMVKDRHYGVIPGTGKKPTLLKGGAELLGVMFRLRAEYAHDRKVDGDDLTIFSKCSLINIETGQKVGEGNAICSTRESKYAYRNAGRKCPKCTKEAIYKSKEEWGGGFYCNAKAGGCGAKFSKDSPEAKALETQPQGKVPNEDLPDVWNTVSKMADKRSNIAAILSTTAASEVFTQDLEDMQENIQAGNPTPAPAPQQTAKEAAAEIVYTETTLNDVLKVTKKVYRDGPSAGKHFYEIALTGGVIVKTDSDEAGLAAKALEGKKALVEFNSKTSQLLKISSVPMTAEETSEVEP